MTPAALAAPVAALVRRCGSPVRVASRDDGHRFTFLDDGATVDALVDPDRNAVLALDVRAGAPLDFTVDIDGTAHSFSFGMYSLTQADSELTASADVAFGPSRAYRAGAQRELVLDFDTATHRLARLVFGERATLVQIGALPRSLGQSPFPYAAPVLKHTAVPDGEGTHATIVRCEIDRFGVVRNVTIVAASGDDAFDAALATRLDGDRYAPARLSGRPIASSAFRELRH